MQPYVLPGPAGRAKAQGHCALLTRQHATFTISKWLTIAISISWSSPVASWSFFGHEMGTVHSSGIRVCTWMLGQCLGLLKCSAVFKRPMPEVLIRPTLLACARFLLGRAGAERPFTRIDNTPLERVRCSLVGMSRLHSLTPLHTPQTRRLCTQLRRLPISNNSQYSTLWRLHHHTRMANPATTTFTGAHDYFAPATGHRSAIPLGRASSHLTVSYGTQNASPFATFPLIVLIVNYVYRTTHPCRSPKRTI